MNSLMACYKIHIPAVITCDNPLNKAEPAVVEDVLLPAHNFIRPIDPKKCYPVGWK